MFSGHAVTQDQLRKTPRPNPSGDLILTSINWREEVETNIYRPDGGFDTDALATLDHAMRCRRTGHQKPIDPRLYEVLSLIYDEFGEPIDLLSGYRNQRKTTSFHYHGSAADIRIAGVSIKQLRDFAASLDQGGMGIGIYPRAGFVHVDVRPESYRWTDHSRSSSDGGKRPPKNWRKRVTARPTV